MAAIDLKIHLDIDQIKEHLLAEGWRPVVLCRECMHRDKCFNAPEWYCADGERKEEIHEEV